MGIRFDFYHDYNPPTILWLLCFWSWSIFFGGLQCPPVNDGLTSSCDFSALTGGDERTPFYSVIFNNLKDIWIASSLGDNE